MAYFAPDSSKDENSFEYPDPESTLDVQSQHQTQMSEYPFFPQPYSYPSPSHQAMYQATTSIAEHLRRSSSSNQWHEVPGLEQVAPVPPSPPRPPLDGASQYTKNGNHRFVPYPAGRQQRPRGTTGKVVCADCGGKFTVKSSLNRHSKLCRGGKKAWQPASAQHENLKVPVADRESDLGIHTLAADEHDSVSSEGVSSVAGSNSNMYQMPTNSTRFASHRSKNAIMANDFSNDALLPAKSDWSPPGEPDQAEGLDSNFHTISAYNTSFSPPNAQNASSTSDPCAPSPYSQKPIGTRSYVPQSGDTSADHAPFLCDACYGIFIRRDLLQLHRASTHGLTDMPYLPE